MSIREVFELLKVLLFFTLWTLFLVAALNHNWAGMASTFASAWFLRNTPEAAS